MKKLYTIAFISLLAISCRAGELASSFKQAAALADAQTRNPLHRHMFSVI
jgi:hypothetical protein